MGCFFIVVAASRDKGILLIFPVFRHYLPNLPSILLLFLRCRCQATDNFSLLEGKGKGTYSLQHIIFYRILIPGLTPITTHPLPLHWRAGDPVRKRPALYSVTGILPDVHRWWGQEKAMFLLVEAWSPYASTHSWWASLHHMTCQECARVGIKVPYCVLSPFPLRTTPIIWLCV